MKFTTRKLLISYLIRYKCVYNKNMSQEKISGVLLSVSSLPGKYGIGQIGKSAYNFVDFLSEAGFKYWEILPLCPTNNSNSPYQGTSALGLNTYFIDYDLLIDEGLLNSRDFQGINFGKDARQIDFKKIFDNNKNLLFKAFKRFDKKTPQFIKFCTNKIFNGYAMYMTLKELNNFKAWYDWRLEDRYFEPEVEEYVLKEHKDLFLYNLFTQFIFCKQWNQLKKYANSKGIKILGQIAHFIGYDSDEVYLHPDYFNLDKLLRMTEVAGFPPDDFSKDGQKWGEPLYDWPYLKSNHYKWRINRFNHAFYFYDYVMINHFSGFYKAYSIPFRAKNAKKGEFIYNSGSEVVNAIKNNNIIANDLGNTDSDIEKFVSNTGFPTPVVSCLGYFRRRNNEKFLPSNIGYNNLLYVGNHDNKTLRQSIENLTYEDRKLVFDRSQSECEKLNIDSTLNIDSNRDMFTKIIETVGNSNAKFVSFTMQDILYQNGESRMNRPGKTDDKLNWTYRFLQSDITKVIVEKWKQLNKEFKR